MTDTAEDKTINPMIAHLEVRIRALEDRAEIMQLLFMHPLAIDAGEGEYWMSNWTEDAVVDRLADPDKHSGDFQGVYGKAPMLAEINSAELADLRKSGLMHVNSPPSILIDGDVASATSYTQLVVSDGNGCRIRRAVVNRWELRRQSDRWMIAKRTIRAMANDQSFSLMRGGLDRAEGGRT